MIVIGVTGSFGTGKSFVAAILKSFGAKVIDADAIAHDVIKKGTPAYRKIVSEFGCSISVDGKEINRRRLASCVFGNKNNTYFISFSTN